jgi:hypothetical protein
MNYSMIDIGQNMDPQNPQPHDISQLVTEVEKKLLDHIIENVEKQRLKPEEAQKLAQDFLALLPMRDKEDLLTKLHTLSEKYHEAQSVYVEYAREDEEAKRQALLHQMSHHIKAGDIEAAIAVAKGGQTNG